MNPENQITKYRILKTQYGVRVVVEREDGYITTKALKDLPELNI